MLVCSAHRHGPECAFATICTFILLVTIVDPGRQRHGYTVHFYQLLVKDGQYQGDLVWVSQKLICVSQ